MRHSKKRSGAVQSFACVSMAVVLFTSLSESTQASDFNQQPGVAGGARAMLGLRIPFGGNVPTESQSTLALRLGSSWRDAPGSFAAGGYRFVPAMEAGFTLRGEPVFKFGAFDIAASANAEGGEPEKRFFCAENAAICLIGGALAIGGVVWAVSAANRGDNGPCLWAQGCD